MKWIGLTGSIGTGKSTVSQLLKDNFIPVIDADDIAKKVVDVGSPGLKAVGEEFGREFIFPDGSLDRRKLGQYIFTEPKGRQRLEAILHPLIQKETYRQRKQLEDKKEPLAIYDIPLLYETNAQPQFDAVIVVACTEEQQKERLRLRHPQWTEEEIESRIAAQIPMAIKEKAADFIVHNDGDRDQLKKEMDRLLIWLSKISSENQLKP